MLHAKSRQKKEIPDSRASVLGMKEERRYFTLVDCFVDVADTASGPESVQSVTTLAISVETCSLLHRHAPDKYYQYTLL